MQKVTINKKHYNAVILLTSFVDRINYQIIKSQELLGGNETPDFIHTEALQAMLSFIKVNGSLNESQLNQVITIHEEVSKAFPLFFKQSPVSFEEKLSAIYASFMAERTLQENLAQLNLMLEVPSTTNFIAQIAFYDEQLKNINKVVNQIKAGEPVTQLFKIQIDKNYHQLTSIKPQLQLTLQNIQLLFVEQ